MAEKILNKQSLKRKIKKESNIGSQGDSSMLQNETSNETSNETTVSVQKPPKESSDKLVSIQEQLPVPISQESISVLQPPKTLMTEEKLLPYIDNTFSKEERGIQKGLVKRRIEEIEEKSKKLKKK